MTRERTIEVLKAWDLNWSDEFTANEFEQAFAMAISALSDYDKMQEISLDLAFENDELINKSRWIPVSERLPEIHQDVLLSLRSLDVEVGFRGETEPYYYCHGDYIEPQNVLAWQPLPEPYNADMRGDT